MTDLLPTWRAGFHAGRRVVGSVQSGRACRGLAHGLRDADGVEPVPPERLARRGRGLAHGLQGAEELREGGKR